jgi:hypothetical protein
MENKEVDFYNKAIQDVYELCQSALEDCINFANQYNYEKEWVLDRFQEQFSKLKKEEL